MTPMLVLGAVAYDPKVITIWEGFRTWLRQRDFALDFVLYSNYERQVDELLAGRIDVAWNSPLAWVRAQRAATARGGSVRAVAMRDTDRDLTTAIVVRSDSPVQRLTDLAGRVLGVGAFDSPQATLLPLSMVRASGLVPDSDLKVERFDVGVGLHGDHIGGERQAVSALRAGSVDAACVLDSNLLLFGREGTLPSGSVRVIAQTEPFDHCNMTAAPDTDQRQVDRFAELLLSMSYADAEARPLLDLEGLTAWLPARLTGYAALERAVDEAGFYDQAGQYIGLTTH